jgi:BASS family bile acid:Na+ symporter
MLSRVDDRTLAAGLLATGIVCGLLVPEICLYSEPFALPSLFCMIILSLVPYAQADRGDFFNLSADVWRIVGWQQFVLPAIILAAGFLARFPPSLITLTAVTACAGSLFASPAFAGLLGLNRKKALQCMVLSTFVMPFSYSIFLTIIHGSEFHLEIAAFIRGSALFLVLPLAVFMVYRSISARFSPFTLTLTEEFSRSLSVVALLVFGIGIMGPAAQLLRHDPEQFIFYLFIATILGVGMAFLTTVVMFRQGFNDALTASVLSGFRNVGLGFALLGNMLGSETAVYVGISQIPIFLAPIVMRLIVPVRSMAEQTAAAPA